MTHKEYMETLRRDDARRTKGVFEALERAIKLTHERAARQRAAWEKERKAYVQRNSKEARNSLLCTTGTH